jgi:hypothetical protein
MTKNILYLFLLLFLTQPLISDEFEDLLNNGKAEFKKEIDIQDYPNAIQLLDRATLLRPDNAEAHYYLGYAYSRLNSNDGKEIIHSSLSLVLKSSSEFEKVIELTPSYVGEILILDPYSKLSAEWGTLAMSYWHNNQPDSAIWAFKEGKNRGGFADFFLTMNRSVLDLCSNNAILMSSGDNFTIPLWYLQIVEGYRKDVSVIDINLLNTVWYPKFLSQKRIVKFDINEKDLDSIEYIPWSDSTITVDQFSWIVKPSYYEQFILRGDRIFLSLLKENKFIRDIYFTAFLQDESKLNLGRYMHNYILVDELNIENTAEPIDKSYITKIRDNLKFVSENNQNSTDELKCLFGLRDNIINQIKKFIIRKKMIHARELLQIMDTFIDEIKYPYQNELDKQNVDDIRSKL